MRPWGLTCALVQTKFCFTRPSVDLRRTSQVLPRVALPWLLVMASLFIRNWLLVVCSKNTLTVSTHRRILKTAHHAPRHRTIPRFGACDVQVKGRFPPQERRPTFLLFSERLPAATTALWRWMRVKMLPSPSKFHYTFNMRELSRVFQVS